MPRLQTSTGVVVNVSDKTAKNLAERGGYSPVTGDKPKPAPKKSASK
jgi:hypothetical protein